MINNKAFKTLDTVTILRAISCLIIITIHAPLPASIIHTPIGTTITTVGFVGIYAFFFLSGFILGKRYLENKYSISRKGILAFYFRRLKRIVPLYYIVVFYLFYFSPVGMPQKLQEIIRLLTFTASDKIQISNGSYLWFISTIMQMYLVAPLGFAVLKFISRKTPAFRFYLFITILFLGSVIRSIAVPFASYEFITQSIGLNLYIFLSGMLFSSFKKDIKISGKLYFGFLSFIFIAIFFSFANIISGSSQISKLVYQTAVIPSISFLLIALILSIFPFTIPVHAFSPWLILQTIGVFSYEIYLLHQPVLNFLNLPCFLSCSPLNFIANIAVVTIISLMIAVGIRMVISFTYTLLKKIM